MIVEYIRYKIPADQQSAFEAAYAQAQSALNESRNCLGWEIAHCTEAPGHYTVRLIWDSLDGHLHEFRQSQQFHAFFNAVQPFVTHIEEMQHYQPTAIQHQKVG